MTKEKIKKSWNQFIEFFDKKIIPIYWNHEKDFDFVGIHGRKHIARSVIFAEIMARFYFINGERKINFEGIRTAVAFHDSGREGNGRDYWEMESSNNCKAYLLQLGKGEEYSDQISKMIFKGKDEVTTRENQIVHDADVLEIMRLFSGSSDGLEKFRTSELLFLSKDRLHEEFTKSIFDLRKRFIRESWDFITDTELNINLTSEFSLNDFLSVFQNNKEKYDLMNQIFKFQLENIVKD